ncbi:MAG: putative methyltransferase [Candidatus Hydrogenedentes bacterium ADurb.Bin179]|nr:MAG: putative methyltransferase [Candidatus Hydrogenedentes bacterium ADurb.Bin179]
MAKTINWTACDVELGDLKPWDRNPKSISKNHARRLIEYWQRIGQFQTIAIGPGGEVYDGHQRLSCLLSVYGASYVVKCLRSSRPLTDEERQELVIAAHVGTTGQFDWDALSGWDAGQLQEWGMDAETLASWNSDANALREMLEAAKEEPPEDPGAQIDKAEELREKWGVETGQLWQLGEHRLICGDCTDRAVVERVMGGERAVLVHADPPYGMGKENEGIENDNLYREKLDEFQMKWWRACRPLVEDNGSAYIWGNSENLWRLWYCGGLRDSERLTFRNEIVWEQEGSSWGKSGMAGLRQFAQNGERALFFMLGEQGFNNNSDNYWDGWEGIRSSLMADCEKMGWGPKDIERICGVGMYSHWFTKSQWTFIPEEHYRKLQAAAREHDAFKREHDELKREHDELKREHDELKRKFYATRSYFDNTHDNSTDIWLFERVKGDDRFDHATPKPVEMMARVVKSSSPDGAVVLVPFGGTLPELIACERLGRKCRAVEISPAYCAVAIQRWVDMTGGTPELITS